MILQKGFKISVLLIGFTWLAVIHQNRAFVVRHAPFRIRTNHVNILHDTEGQLSETVASESSGRNVTSGINTKSMDIQQLKDSIDILSVIESYNLEKFKRNGIDRATAVCPFHNDHNPSLSIDGGRQIYKCFSCGEGGDVFRFVREYNKIHGREISFGEAVREITSGSNFVAEHGLVRLSGRSAQSSNEATPRRVTAEERALSERILLANAAAANFYADTLMQPSAGGARAHLRERGLAPVVAKTFGLGYAPDAFFGNSRRDWGQGSLVEHLKGLGFTAAEIVKAGLATQTQRRTLETDEDDSEVATPPTFDNIIDRFRNRLIVPILDATGKKVLAFGGRVLDDASETEFYNPKYLNSPESLVFHKKDILFGMNLANIAVRGSVKSADLIMVEGYMDAIALYSKGLKTAVATMGTAVSQEQLNVAASAVSQRGGRVMICMDNDEAGKAATERICSNGIIFNAVKRFPLDIRVVMLPDMVKDPAEYVEYLEKGGMGQIDIVATVNQLFDESPRWQSWMIDRILDRYDKNATTGKEGSFQDIFEGIANFLADVYTDKQWPNEASRIKGTLASILGFNATQTDSGPGSIEEQLEEDLIDLTSRIYGAKNALVERGLARTAGGRISAEKLAASFSRGQGPSGSDESEFLSRRALNITEQVPRRAKMKTRKPKTKVLKKKPIPRPKQLTPHFSGISFANKADAEWVGVQTDKQNNKMILGKFRENIDNPYKRVSPVYFNSNSYHGTQFLTESAHEAGYKNVAMRIDPDFLLKGIGSLVKRDLTAIHVQTEDEILRLAVRSSRARLVMKRAIEARLAVNSMNSVHWSTIEKEWLFKRLTVDTDLIPSDCHDARSMREYLKSLPDAPEGSFDENLVDSSESFLLQGVDTGGTLEPHFCETDVLMTSNSTDLEGLRAQELLSLLQMTSTSKTTEHILAQLDHVLASNETDLYSETSFTNTTSSELVKPQAAELIRALQSQTKSMLSYAESSRRVTRKLLDQIGAEKLEGRVSMSLQQQVVGMVEDYLVDFKDPGPPSSRGYFPGERNDENYEDAIERLQSEWGDWFDDDYVWSSDERKNGSSKSNGLDSRISEEELEEEETLEEGLERIKREWADWIDGDLMSPKDLDTD